MKSKSPPLLRSPSSGSTSSTTMSSNKSPLKVLPRLRVFFLLAIGLTSFAMVQQAQISVGHSANVGFELPSLPNSSSRHGHTGSTKGRSRSRKKSHSKSHSHIKSGSTTSSTSLSEKPSIVWLMSYPNSGTSYTMTMVERASNRSTATNYGVEVTHTNSMSIPVHEEHPEGPYWEGLSGDLGTPRHLPDNFVLSTCNICVTRLAFFNVLADEKSILRSCAFCGC
jgi:hypothetical protein